MVGSSTLYWYGGRRGKWKRRFIGAIALTSTVIGVAVEMGRFSWWMLAIFPLISMARDALWFWGYCSCGKGQMQNRKMTVAILVNGRVFMSRSATNKGARSLGPGESGSIVHYRVDNGLDVYYNPDDGIIALAP